MATTNVRSNSQQADNFLGWYGNSVAKETHTDGEFAMARLSFDGRLEALRNYGKRLKVRGHFSFSPDQSAFMELENQLTIWIIPLKDGEPQPLFRFPRGSEHIDYRVWSPSGNWVLFDRMISQSGDIYLVEDLD